MMITSSTYYKRFVQGTSRLGLPSKTLYMGVKEGLTYIAPFIEQQFFEPTSLIEVCLEEPCVLQDFFLDSTVDLLIFVMNDKMLQQFISNKAITGITRIHQFVKTDVDFFSVQKNMSSREIKRYRRSLQEGFSYSISHKSEDFFQFYDEMHVPTMQQRYGSKARSVPRDEAHQTLFKKGLLFKIYKEGRWVAGSVGQIDPDKKKLNSRLIGVIDGDIKYRNDGSQNFVYHAILEWACSDNNIDIVDFQGCEPFLTKGTFQYKKRFGTEACIPDNVFKDLRLLIQFPEGNLSALKFLVDNPIINIDNRGKLFAQYFYTDTSSIREDIPYLCNGINYCKYIPVN